jgi:hypothetical protein
MLTQYVHPRLGLPKFLTFEPYFVAGLEAFDKGQDTKFDLSGGLSPSTLAARMRDSLQGYRLNKKFWGDRVSPRFAELYEKHDGQFVIAGPDENNEVWLRARRKRFAYKGTPFNEVEGNLPKYVSTKTVIRSDPAVPSQPAGIIAKDSSNAVVTAYVTLKNLGQLDQPVIFPGPVDPTLIAELTATSDIAFHYDPNRNETVLV